MRITLQLSDHTLKLFACPPFERNEQVHAHSLGAVERHSGKRRESLTEVEGDEKVGTAS